MLRKLWSDDAGQDVPEYALMLALILVLTISVITAIGTDSNSIFGKVKDAMESSIAAS
jgi:Flp pilus assembly pilin Flp